MRGAPLKSTNIDWLKEIPAHWQISKVGYHFNIVLGKMLQPFKINPDDTLENYLCAVNLGKNNLKIDEPKQMWFSQREKEIYALRECDLLVVEGGDVASAAILDFSVENLYFQNALFRVRPMKETNLSYLKYWLNFIKNIGYIELICNKATIAHFTKQKFSKLPFPLPPLEEQKEISAYLDARCEKIEKLSAGLQEEIKYVEELKVSIISEVVTGKKDVRGLI